jgi:hypothetical protein
MATTEWSTGFEDSPAGNTSRRLGDDRIRELKLAIRERMQKGGHYMKDSVAGFAKDGRHVVGVGDGPGIYKSDATTKLIDYTDTAMTLQTGMDLVSTDGIKSSALKANAATFGSALTAGDGTNIAAGTTYNRAGPTLTLGTPKGSVFFALSVHLEGVADNDMTGIAVYFDYLNTGVWTLASVGSAGLWVPLRTAATKKNVTHSVLGLDPMTTPSNGGTVPSRVAIINAHATADIILRIVDFGLIELRR